MKLNDLFDCVYYINLDHRTDRKETFWKLNGDLLDVDRTVRISAINGINKKHNRDYESIITARAAISTSYLQPFKHALQNNYNNIMIFEDDADPMFDSLKEFEIYKNEAEKNQYEILFLGGTVISKLNKFSENLYKLSGNILATQAVCYNNRNNIFQEFSRLPQNLKDMKTFLKSRNDTCLDTLIGKHVTKKRTSFLSNRILFGQYESHSDIEAKQTSYNSMMLSQFKKYKT